MKMSLVLRELWPYISGEAVEPTEDGAEKKSYILNREKALALIALSVESEHQIHIVDCQTASDAWEALEKAFEPRSRPRILQLKKQMVSIRLDQDETMTSYLNKIKKCSDNLKEAGYEIKDDDLAYTMLCGLPDSYDGIIMALTNLDDSKFKSSEVRSMLLNEYERRISKDTIVTREERKEAFHQNKEITNQPRQYRKDERRCYKCNRIGHISKNCRSRMQDNKVRWNQYENKIRRNEAMLAELNNTQIEDAWLIDSGATHHICKYREWFTNYKTIATETIYSADNNVGNNLKAVGIGNVNIETKVNNNIFNISLQNVYHVPNVRRNLLSASQIEKHNKRLIIDNYKVRIQNKRDRMIVGEAFCKGGLYVINAKIVRHRQNNPKTYTINCNRLNESEKWHRRFGHVNIHNIRELSNKGLVRGLENVKIEDIQCNDCVVSKSTKAPCRSVGNVQTKNVLELVHSDLCGPLPVNSIGGSRYFLTFTDDYSRKTIVYGLKGKYEVSNYIRKYIARVERETDKRIKRIRTDNGLEFCNKNVTALFDEMGIKHERTNAYTPQMNGVAERVNRTLLNLVRAMLRSANLPDRFWGETLLAACYIRNRVVHSNIEGDVPEGVWTGNKPSIKHLRIYGCLAYVHINQPGRNKLSSRAKECVFVGYSNRTKGYRLWDPVKNDVIHSKHVEFRENINGYEFINNKINFEIPFVEERPIRELRESDIVDQSANETEDNEDNEQDITETPKRTVMDVRANLRENENDSEETEDNVIRYKKIVRNPWGCKGKPKNVEINLTEIEEPTTYELALNSPQSKEWKLAIDDELKGLESRDAWKVVDRRENMKCIGSRWIFKVKTDSNGKIVRYRARLVAQGFNQKKNVDYFESYAPLTSLSTIRLLLSMSVCYNWIVQHLDVKCAYLYGNLKEEIHMELPPGSNLSENKVAKLNKPIYGLKQSGRDCNNTIDVFLIKNGFQRLKTNNCIYVYENEVILTIYVDDIILFGKNEVKLQQTKTILKSQYEIRDLGLASYLLGINIRHVDDRIELSQKLYIEKLLEKYNMKDCKGVKIPMEVGIRLSSNDSNDQIVRDEMRDVPYRQLIGSLMYLAHATRPDIMYAVVKLAQFVSNPGKTHWIQAKKILRYLSITKDKVLTYNSGDVEIEIFSDADWASDLEDRHSCSGMTVFMGGNLIHWKSSKQRCITTSTMEAEYVALEIAVKEAMWTNMFFNELQSLFDVSVPKLPYVIRCDNKSAIDFTVNRVERAKSKHIDIAYHITREKYEEGLIELKYVSSKDNVADLFTKALSYDIMYIHLDKLRLRQNNSVTKVGD